MKDAGSTVPRRQLGRELRKLREEAGIQVSSAAAALEWSGPKLWRIERGLTSMRALDVEQMCRLYGADERTTEALMSVARATKDRGWWHAYGDSIPKWFELYVGLEQAATGLRTYEPELVPGLLQTAGYAGEVIRTSQPKLPDEEVERLVQVRMTRQLLVSRQVPPAPRFDVIIGESVLRRMPEDPVDTREQLLHLVEMAGRPGVSVSILPFSAGLHGATTAGAFTILDFPVNGGKPSEPTTVYSEGLTGALYLDQPNEITQFEETWANIADKSLIGEDAIEVIRAQAEELR